MNCVGANALALPEIPKSIKHTTILGAGLGSALIATR